MSSHPLATLCAAARPKHNNNHVERSASAQTSSNVTPHHFRRVHLEGAAWAEVHPPPRSQANGDDGDDGRGVDDDDECTRRVHAALVIAVIAVGLRSEQRATWP